MVESNVGWLTVRIVGHMARGPEESSQWKALTEAQAGTKESRGPERTGVANL